MSGYVGKILHKIGSSVEIKPDDNQNKKLNGLRKPKDDMRIEPRHEGAPDKKAEASLKDENLRRAAGEEVSRRERRRGLLDAPRPTESELAGVDKDLKPVREAIETYMKLSDAERQQLRDSGCDEKKFARMVADLRSISGKDRGDYPSGKVS